MEKSLEQEYTVLKYWWENTYIFSHVWCCSNERSLQLVL